MQKDMGVYEYILNKPFLSLIIGLMIIILSVYLSDIPTMILSKGWPTTEGTISKIRIMEQRFEEYDGDIYTETEGMISYQYSVNNISYTSHTVNAITTPLDFYSGNILERYPKDKEVVVYYNPKNPAESVLEPGFVFDINGFNIISQLLIVIGIYFFARGFSRIAKDKNTIFFTGR